MGTKSIIERFILMLVTLLPLVTCIYFMAEVNSFLHPYAKMFTLFSSIWIVLGAVVALLLKRSVIFYLLLSTLIFKILIFDTSLQELQKSAIYILFTLFLPFNITLFSFLQNRGFLTPYGLGKIAVLAFEAVIVFFVLNYNMMQTMALLNTQFLPFNPLPNLTDLAFCLNAILIITLLTKEFFHSTLVKSGFVALFVLIHTSFYLTYNPLVAQVMLNVFIVFAFFVLVWEYYQMAYVDELTQVASRRAFEAELLTLGNRYAIAMADIDHFKKFNDTYGHDVGDIVLQRFAASLSLVKGRGKVFRYGGEEFSIVFRNIDVKEAFKHLESVRELIAKEKHSFQNPKKKEPTKVNVTASFGVAEAGKKATTPQEVLKLADTALYKSKKAGRNKVSIG